MMNSPGWTAWTEKIRTGIWWICPTPPLPPCRRRKWSASTQKYGYLGLHWMQTGAQNADGYCYYDIVRGGMDKGVGLADLCAQMGLTLADAVAVGDSANDVAMLKAAGLSACMANGTRTPRPLPTGSSGTCGRTAWRR